VLKIRRRPPPSQHSHSLLGVSMRITQKVISQRTVWETAFPSATHFSECKTWTAHALRHRSAHRRSKQLHTLWLYLSCSHRLHRPSIGAEAWGQPHDGAAFCPTTSGGRKHATTRNRRPRRRGGDNEFRFELSSRDGLSVQGSSIQYTRDIVFEFRLPQVLFGAPPRSSS
jgi:hypothetical protein